METLKQSFSLFGRYIVCQIFCFFLVFSIIAGFTMIGAEMVGYNAYVISGEEITEEYTHYYSSGEDTKKAEYEKQGLTVKTQQFSDGLKGTPLAVALTLSQLCTISFFIAFVPYKLYKLGGADINKASRGAIEKDMLRGLKISGITTAVSLGSYVLLILGKLGIFSVGLSVYNFANYYLYGYMKLIFGEVTSASQIDVLGIMLAVLPVILLPASCAVAYIIGIKDINFYDKIVLKNNE